jgi:ABC-2 type transporter
MQPFAQQLRVTMLLHFRNRMAIIYSYLFPTIFLIAFWVLYRHERVPLARHMGELLTVTALGGACFGLPTTMVSERERGVWRRYRLAPVPTGALLASTVVARYVLLILAGLLQVALAMLVGMPVPNHPFDLWLAFTFVAFALLGLGLVIATLADNVPAVQALGQCIFLPMLIIGGVAVQLASLPDWAQHVSAFFPGRYAVEAIQAAVTGNGLGSIRFSLLALFLIGAAGSLAGVKMFRWDANQRFATRPGKAWVGVALAAWLAVGALAETRGRIRTGGAVGMGSIATTPTSTPAPPVPPVSTTSAPPAVSTGPGTTAPPEAATSAAKTPAEAPSKPNTPETKTPAAASKPAPSVAEDKPKDTATPTLPAPAKAGSSARTSEPPPEPKAWQQVTPAHIDEVMFERLPADSGVVTPIAPPDEEMDPEVAADIDEVRSRLVTWGPARVADPVQRVRNVLYVAAVPDVFQIPHERYLPRVVFERLQEDVPKEDLIKILFWVATHPNGGDDSAVDDLRSVGLKVDGPSDIDQVRERVMIYALKLLGRLVGKIPR